MRILSLAPSNTEIVFKLESGDELIGTTSLCDYPSKAVELPSVGGWNSQIKYDKIYDLNPEIILTSDSLQEKARMKLQKDGFNVFHVEPTNLEELYQSIISIGTLLNKEENAKEIVQSMKKEIASINLQNSKIYCEEWSKPPMVSGNWIPDLINEANGNYFIQKGRSRKTNLTKLKKFDPDYIFLNICGAGEKADLNTVKSREDLSETKAVKNNNIYVINDSLLNRPSPRITEGLKEIDTKIS